MNGSDFEKCVLDSVKTIIHDDYAMGIIFHIPQDIVPLK